MLHPAGRVTEIQRRQMTTVDSPNIANVAIDGTFDDCQDLVKALFADRPFRERMRLGAVNSINWARVAAQTVYYATTAVRLGAPANGVSFCVPTGNFGNVLAGDVARRMGVPIDRLVVATNHNDILARTHRTGEMEIREVRPSTSPAMDIQVSSNFERLLFELGGRRGAALAADMARFRAEDALVLAPEVLEGLRAGFDSGSASEDDVSATIARRERIRWSAHRSPYRSRSHGGALECLRRWQEHAHGGHVHRSPGQVRRSSSGGNRHRAGVAPGALRPGRS